MNKFYKDETYRLNISISDRCYNHKPTAEDYKSMSFHVEDLTVTELVERIKSGYSICHVFKGNRRTKSNFMYANAVFIDIDDSTIPMEELIKDCELKPTIAYTTFSDGRADLHRFRFIYVLNESVATEEEYKHLYFQFVNGIQLVHNKDNCGSVTAQLMNGNSNPNVRTYCSNFVFRTMSFLQNCQCELYTHTPTQYDSNRHICKNGE